MIYPDIIAIDIMSSKSKDALSTIVNKQTKKIASPNYGYYAPPSRFEGPRRCPDRGNAGGALVFSQELVFSF